MLTFFRLLRHFPFESMTMMLMMLVLFVHDHLCKALVRLAASCPRALLNRASDAAFLDRLSAKIPSCEHGTIMHLRRQRPQASAIDVASWFEVACRKQASIIRIIVLLFWTEGVSKDSIISTICFSFCQANDVQGKVSIRSMTFLVVDHLHTSSDDADDADPRKRLF